MSDIRILKGTGPTDIEKRAYQNGTQADVGTMTVAITDDDGNVIQAAGGATSKTGSGATTLYTYTLAVQATETLATITWSATTGTQTFTDRLQIIGGWLFTESELRNYYGQDLADTDADFTDALLAESRDRITEDFERICAQAFVPTYRRQFLSGTGTRHLELERPYLRSIIAASIGGTAQTVADLDLHQRLPWVIHTTAWWTTPTAADPYNVIISYVHGQREVPYNIKRAALMLARLELIKDVKGTGIPDTASAHTDATGTTSFAPNDQTGRWYGIPYVDNALRDASRRIPVAVG